MKLVCAVAQSVCREPGVAKGEGGRETGFVPKGNRARRLQGWPGMGWVLLSLDFGGARVPFQMSRDRLRNSPNRNPNPKLPGLA